MTPAARVQAAIEVLDLVRASIIEKGRPAEAILRDYFAARRYAGSKDRAAVTALVYQVIRHWRSRGWQVGVQDGLAAGRHAILSLFRRSRERGTPSAQESGIAGWVPAFAGTTAEEVFSGGYGPAPLTVDEQTLLSAASPPAPETVALDIPDWLEPALRQRFGADFAAECAALNSRAPLDLRVNLLKSSRKDMQETLESLAFAVEPHLWSPWGLRLPGGAALANLPPYTSGAIEVQDQASQCAALLAGAKPGETVIDLCAGAAGKTLALAAAMQNRGRVLAFDIRRAAEFDARIARAGVTIVEFRQLPREGGGRAATLAGVSADRVLVDAPCSGSGTWRRAPDAKWRLAPDHLALHVKTQAALRAEAAALVRPGGRLVYATCSLLPVENEEQVQAFLGGRPDFTLLDYRAIWPAGDPPPTRATDPRMLQFTPATHGTDGFFIAAMERRK